jgi:Flp pilus assembly protein TadD
MTIKRKAILAASLVAAIVLVLPPAVRAGDLKITLPKKSKVTPVQQLNREGVRELRKHNLEQAKRLFYKAYLLDPDDPFTLNNLGYISELDGDADRALRYYELSSKNHSQAVIDVSSRPELKGQSLQNAYASLQVPELKSNKDNVRAISLLGQGRVAEAEAVLQKALAQDPQNPFTLNNLGFVMENEGDLQGALRYYGAAAANGSDEKILVTPNPKWRGRDIREVAAENARLVSEVIAKGEDLDAQVARLNLRGVAAINHNDPKGARQFFEQAYKLDPRNAFSLNNMGYVSEMEGDRETAETYYADARAAGSARQQVTYATRREAEGRPVGDVARNNEDMVQSRIEAMRQIRMREGGPIELKRRDNTPVREPEGRQEPPLSVPSPPLPRPQMPELHEQPEYQQPGEPPQSSPPPQSQLP